MFNIGSGELVLIAVVALLVLGPKRLPELARGLGKFLREFRRQTDEVRGVVEREFYRMDQEIEGNPPPAQLAAAVEPIPVPVTADGAVPVEPDLPMDHSDPRHPDYGKPDPHVLAEDPPISHHLDPTPPHVEAAVPAPDAPTAADSEKKAS